MWLVALRFVLAQYVVPLALLERSMRFATIARIDVLAFTLGAVAAVAAALAGFGYYSLAMSPLVQSVVPAAVRRPRGGARAMGVLEQLHCGQPGHLRAPTPTGWSSAGCSARSSSVSLTLPESTTTISTSTLWRRRATQRRDDGLPRVTGADDRRSAEPRGHVRPPLSEGAC